MRLSPAILGRLPSSVRSLAYARDDQAIGLVHFGIGAFHRAHQAIYTEEAMAAGDRDWAIAGVSLRSNSVHHAMAPQGCLFAVSQRSDGRDRVALVKSVREVVHAPADPARVTALLSAPGVRVATFTITEAGYLQGASTELDWRVPALVHDMSPERRGARPETVYGYLAAGLRQRRTLGLGGLTLISCDNLSENGTRLGSLLLQYLERVDPGLRAWVETECAFPSTMVDRIVPATTDEDLRRIAAVLGVCDQAAVVTEPFRQWVIEDKFAGARPQWDVAGAKFVEDVRAYETQKLRMLNGAHSALAYLGLQRGYQFVHEAIADHELKRCVEDLMGEAARSVRSAETLSPGGYAEQLLTRFANSDLPHSLKQIARDGSQKIPQRWLPVLRQGLSRGRGCEAHLRALAAWIDFMRAPGREDPLAGELADMWRRDGRAGIVASLFGEAGVLARHWTAPPYAIERITRLLQVGDGF